MPRASQNISPLASSAESTPSLTPLADADPELSGNAESAANKKKPSYTMMEKRNEARIKKIAEILAGIPPAKVPLYHDAQPAGKWILNLGRSDQMDFGRWLHGVSVNSDCLFIESNRGL